MNTKIESVPASLNSQRHADHPGIPAILSCELVKGVLSLHWIQRGIERKPPPFLNRDVFSFKKLAKVFRKLRNRDVLQSMPERNMIASHARLHNRSFNRNPAAHKSKTVNRKSQ